ncbi:type II secretion system protein GspC [Kangiella sediminilitoris]|uniref:Type II secretory pathway component PulC-like protein n=1 Tax=Kangiella sediminilitoris TaxID=1144748 RepID=A0A1B3B895_9GAMM|nr:type II secretion system protein GspC [Kangiella sediminilitoris]AOE49018.1 Type II secretory pathway component PulC-like protein [Kangiella sediminilitoris]
MNVTSKNFTQFVQQRGRLIARIVALVLGVICLYVLAKLVWLWVDYFQPMPAVTPVNTAPIPDKQPTVNIERIAAMHLFGEANAPVEQQVEAEETKLNLKLLGTYVSDDDNVSSAIIQSNGSQEDVYFIGDKLKVRGNVTLHQVETLKVIIKNGGKFETLTLLEQLNKQVLSTAKKPELSESQERTIDKRRDVRLSRELSEMKQKLYENPQSFMDVARVERVIGADGQVSGYKVAPGKDPRMFTRLGLRRNDVITSVNGQPLNDKDLMGMLTELNSAQSVEVTIERNGQPVTLLLGFSDLSNQRPQPNLNERDGNARQIR